MTIENIDQGREDTDSERRTPGEQANRGEVGLAPGGQRQVYGGEKMRADAKQARQPEEPSLVTVDDATVRLIGRGMCRDDAKVAVFERTVDPEPCGVPVVEGQVNQREEQKDETKPAVVIDHQAGAEFPPLIIEEK